MTQSSIGRSLELGVIMSLTLLLSVTGVSAQTTIPAAQATLAAPAVSVQTARFFTAAQNEQGALVVADEKFGGMMDATAVDLGGDGIDEIAVGYGFADKPEVVIYRADGSVVNRWFPYGEGYKGRVLVASGDLNGDGKLEIVTGPGEGGGPHIRIFDGFGATLYGKGFFATLESNRRGTDIALGDINGDGRDEIVVSLITDNAMVIKAFNGYGEPQMKDIEIATAGIYESAHVTVADMNADGKGEIILGAAYNQKPMISVYQADGTRLADFGAYEDTMKSGVNVTTTMLSGNRVIVTSPEPGYKSWVRFFNLNGEPVVNPLFMAFDEAFMGGTVMVTGNFGEGRVLLALPQVTTQNKDISSFGKLILVDLSEQRLYAYNRGVLEKTFLISSGIWRFPTPVGTYAVYRKRPVTRMVGFYAPGSKDNYDLPNVKWAMSFYGAYNLHGTYWHANFGHPMSHGCVNISNKNAEWLYKWSPMGTTVKIQK